MSLFRRKKPTYVDALEAAHEKVTEALDVFNVASAGLVEAIANFEQVEDDAEASIRRARTRLQEASLAKAKSQNVLAKIENLTS